MANEQNQMPRIVIVHSTRAPRRHSSETHAVLDDVVDLAIRKILRLRQTHIRNARIKFLPHLRRAAAVVAVATGAMVREMPPRFHQQLRCRLHRIAQLARRARNGPALHDARQSSLHNARIVASAQSRRAQPEYSHDHDDQRDSEQQKYPGAERFHNGPRPAERRGPLPMASKLWMLFLSSGTST